MTSVAPLSSSPSTRQIAPQPPASAVPPSVPSTGDPGVSGDAPHDSMNIDELRSLLGRRDTRPSPPSAMDSVAAMSWRTLLKIRHTPEQLFDVTGLPILMVLMFSVLFGGSVAGSTRDYVQYIIPGILTMSVLMTTMYTGITLNVDVRTGVLDRFRTLPIWRPSIFVGYLAADTVRYALASTSIIAVGLILGYRPAGGPVGLLAGVAVVLVVAFCLSWMWTTLGLLVSDERVVTSVSMGVLYPLCFVSNILVEPATLPGWLRVAVELSPVTNTVTSVRSLAAGAPDLGALAITAGYMTVIVAIFAPLTMKVYNGR